MTARKLSLFELTVGGIHGEKPDEVRANFIELCHFLKVSLDASDIVYTRFLKQDKSHKSVKSHNILVRLHSSKLVSQILTARRGLKKNNGYKPLSHVSVFPRLTATNRLIYIRPMLTEYKYALLRLANEAKCQLDFKYCWATDNGTIFLKKDDSADPILIRDENSLTGIINDDNWLDLHNSAIFNIKSSFHSSTQNFLQFSLSFLNINSLRNKVDYIHQLITQDNLHFFGLNETWLSNAITIHF